MGTLLVSGSLLAAHKASASSGTTYDITTLAGKVASLRGTAGLQLRFSAFLEQEADDGLVFDPSGVSSPINPTFVLSSPLDGTSIAGPAVTVNGDTAGAPQNETAIAVDPNNPNRVVAAANDYVTRTWNCTLNGLPCSAQGDGYSGTYFSNDGGATWCCTSNLDGTSQGTLIPGVDHLSGGQYDAGGDPALAFDSHGNVYYAGLGFDRTAPPNTVAVNRGAFDGSGHLSWSAPTFINQTTSPSTLNDKEWIAADHFASSPFRDRVYVSYTRFIFNAHNGAFVQAPIQFVYSTDGGQTFSAPKNIVGNVLYDQGSRPVVGPDGAVYVFFKGSTRLATLNSTYVVKSTDGGVTFGQPVAISTLHDIAPPTDTAFRVNSFPAAAANPVNGDLYAAWSTEETDANGHHAAAVYSVSHDGGASWSTPALIFPDKDTATRTPDGYGPDIPISPDTRTVDTFWPGVTVSPNGRVYLSAYAADVVSPWQTCATPDPTGGGVVGRINCLALGPYINNARLDYAVRDLTTGVSQTVSTHPINTRSQFGGGFIGDYTDISAGSDDVFHALWTDTNNKQTVIWFYGFEFQPTIINQEDVAVANDNF
jgi:hypothetical protein